MDRGIVIFDGDCGLCNGFVRWLMSADGNGAFCIASSTDAVGRAALDAVDVPWDVTADTLVVIVDGTPLLRSAAALGVLGRLGAPYRAAAVGGRLVPRRFRDALYDAIARRRRALSDRVRACRVADDEERRLWSSRLATMDDVARLAAPSRAR